MSRSNPNHSQTLRQISATLFFLTFVLTLTTTITTSLTNDPFTHDSLSTYPLITSALATVYTFTLTILTLLSLRRSRADRREASESSKTALRSAALHISSIFLSTLFSGLFIGTIYLSRSAALLPCTAGTTSYQNPYVTYCQLRQTVFWSAVLGAVGFAALAGLAVAMVVRGRRAVGSSFASTTTKEGDGDAVSVAPPSYAEKDGDVEREGEWEERVRGAV